MNVIYIEKKPNNSWGLRTNIDAIEELLKNNKIVLTPDKVDRMPDEFIDKDIKDDGRIQESQR